MTNFIGKVALVTGTSGIGRASARRLAAGGAHVLALGIDPASNAEFDRLAREDGLTMAARLCNASEDAQVAGAWLLAWGSTGGSISSSMPPQSIPPARFRLPTPRPGHAGISTLGDQITSGTSRLVQQSIQVPKPLSDTIVPMVVSVVGYLEPAQLSIARLQERAAVPSFDFGPANLHRRQVEALAKHVPDPVKALSSEPLADARLPEIHALFTMERERDAFRSVFPGRVF